MSDLPRVIVTNDDGIDSPGLRMLAAGLADEFDVVVAAPATDMSGSGTGIGGFDPVKGVDMTTVDMGGITAYTIAGPPGLAVMAAALGAFGRFPDLVVSGINAGMNTGHSIIHSGTVGAALTARTFRSRGIAISLAQSDPWQWDTAVEVGVSAARVAPRPQREPVCAQRERAGRSALGSQRDPLGRPGRVRLFPCGQCRCRVPGSCNS